MELLLRLHSARGTDDVKVDVEPEQPVASLGRALAEYLGASNDTDPVLVLRRTGTTLDPQLAVGKAGVLSGDEVLFNPLIRSEAVPPAPIRGVSVDVLSGPDSGFSVVLGRGVFTLGRDPTCNITVGDQTVSRQHLTVRVADDWSVSIEPNPNTQNGVMVNDQEIAAGSVTPLTGDDVVALGTTRLAFRDFVRAIEEAVDQLGQIEFHRTPYRPTTVRDRTLSRFGPIPTAPERRRFQTMALLAPLGAGLAMYAFSRQIQFLALTMLTPVAMIGNWLEERRSGKSRHQIRVERFRERLDSYREEIRSALEAERVERVRSAPDHADLTRRAELRTIDLWARERTSPDFLRVRIGIGSQPSRVVATVDDSGDDEFRDEVLAAINGHDVIAEVPVVVSMAEIGVLGVHGPADRVNRAAASIVVQSACLQSPEDLIIVGAIGRDRDLAEKLKWIPQTRSVTSPLAGPHIVSTARDAKRLLAEMIEVGELRAAETTAQEDYRWPWLLAVLDGDLDLDPIQVSQLLDLSPRAGISAVWLTSGESRLPRQACAVLDCQDTRGDDRAHLWFTDPESPGYSVELTEVNDEVVDLVARSLSPIRDASVATATTAIPRMAPLLTVLEIDDPTADWVLKRWKEDKPYGLAHPVGLDADGVFMIDLVEQGPHALIGGTSGAGKSELLQSMVASLITLYPPTRLNFLFVDYKGGASSAMFNAVPHTVGSVTNLNANLALRALTSLRAELNRRMALLEGRAKDLEEMLTRFPDEAPASLVIVVDEFATLVKEIPEFVAGIVDIAQRGRSLGIHLILATQRPSGSVNDNILANTNLRMSLRMLDGAESSAIIGSPDAASIPVPLRGRGFARLGPRELVAFQSAYASAPLERASVAGRVTVRPFTLQPVEATLPLERAETSSETTISTHLDVVIDAVAAAAEAGDYPTSTAPWKEVLPDHIVLVDALAHREELVSFEPGRHVVLGMVDAPELQDQFALMADLEDGGGLIVYGSGGSGKTTTLRTIAASAALESTPEDVVIFGLDFASRTLRSIEPLPHVSMVAGGDDLEAATRLIALLSSELDRRRSLLSDARAETVTAYRRLGHRMSRVVLLIDNYPNVAAAFTGGGFGSPLEEWLERLNKIIIDGRQAGIHTVMTADRRSGVTPMLQSAIGNRLVLRQADENSYGDHGIPASRARGLDLRPGQGFWQTERLCQVACVSEDPEGSDQAAEIERLASRAPSHSGPLPLRSEQLRERIDVSHLTKCDSLGSVPIGVVDLTLDDAVINMTWDHFVVCGFARTGRSTTLVTAAAQLADMQPWCFGPTSSPLAAFTDDTRGFGRGATIAEHLERLADECEADTDKTHVVVFDDIDIFDDAALSQLWDRLSQLDNIRVVASLESRNLTGYSTNQLLNLIRRTRNILYLCPTDGMDVLQTLGVKAPPRPGLTMVPGRGVLMGERGPLYIQVAQ